MFDKLFQLNCTVLENFYNLSKLQANLPKTRFRTELVKQARAISSTSTFKVGPQSTQETSQQLSQVEIAP